MAQVKTKKRVFETMNKYLTPLVDPEKRKLVGRQKEIRLLLSALNRPIISNAMLLAPAGTGKTAMVYATAMLDKTPNRYYYQVQLPLMMAGEGYTDGSLEMAVRMTKLVHEVRAYQKATHQELVLFMDEIHQVAKNSPAAMEAIKPILANSGAWHIKIIGATTFEEFNEYIKPNEALMQRFVRITIPQLTFDETLEALRNTMTADLPGEYVDDHLLKRSIDVTNQAQPSESQPRKSIKILDAMIGWKRTFNSDFDEKLLAQMMKASVGVDVDYTVNASQTEKLMNKRVFDQTLATRAVTDRLYISVAGLNDRTRPRGSFLFAGSTGTGKTELAKTMANILFGSDDAMIRFDMSEYSRPESVDILRDRLTEAVWEHPSSVILMDEIEKAAAACTKLLLQVLDDARMTDEHGREVSFKDSYIVFTTNAGAKTFSNLQAMYQSDDRLKPGASDEEAQHVQRKLLKSYMPLIQRALQAKGSQFSPELLGRFDQIVPFSGIGVNTRYKIAKVQLNKLAELVYQKHNVHLHYTDQVYDFIVREHLGANSADSGGGREVRRRIEENVVAKVSEALVKYPQVKDMEVAIAGHMSYNDPHDNEGTAEVVIQRWLGGVD